MRGVVGWLHPDLRFAFQRQVHQTHRTHRTQGIIFAYAPAFIPWMGPRLLPPIVNGAPSGVWVGRGPERVQGQGMPKRHPAPGGSVGRGREKGRGPAFFGVPSAP